MKKLALLFLVATQFGTGSLWAQERGEMLERMFSRMDKNGDGFVEESEAPAEFWARMGKADKNGDGKIDKSEAAEGMKAMADRGRGSGGRPGAGRDEARKPEDRPNRPDSAKDSGGKEKRSADNPGDDRMKQMFERFGKDGKVALADLPAPLRERLAKFDKNNDKFLNREELKDAPINEMGDPARMLERVKQVMQNLDKDGDGKVAIADIPSEFRDRIAQLDKNKDGVIEKSELAELKNIVGGPGAGGGPGNPGERIQQMFAQFDKDGDGKVALADLPEQIKERLSRMDKNNDGQIEKSELAGMAEEMKKMEGRFDRGEDLSPQQPKRPSGSDK
ncbi:MAG: EF-hand domain-containing protein [Pirellulales bacterium]